MRINPVISIAQLEPALAGPDPYNRESYSKPGTEEVDEDGIPVYIIERLLDRRFTDADQKQYLVEWQGYRPANNLWYSVGDLDNAKDLMKEDDEKHPVQPEKSLRRQRRRNRAQERSDQELQPDLADQALQPDLTDQALQPGLTNQAQSENAARSPPPTNRTQQKHSPTPSKHPRQTARPTRPRCNKQVHH